MSERRLITVLAALGELGAAAEEVRWSWPVSEVARSDFMELGRNGRPPSRWDSIPVRLRREGERLEETIAGLEKLAA